MAKVNKDMMILDVLQFGNQEEVAKVLFSYGMHCLGCAIARHETIADAAATHQVDVNELVDAINKVLE